MRVITNIRNIIYPSGDGKDGQLQFKTAQIHEADDHIWIGKESDWQDVPSVEDEEE